METPSKQLCREWPLTIHNERVPAHTWTPCTYLSPMNHRDLRDSQELKRGIPLHTGPVHHHLWFIARAQWGVYIMYMCNILYETYSTVSMSVSMFASFETLHGVINRLKKKGDTQIVKSCNSFLRMKWTLFPRGIHKRCFLLNKMQITSCIKYTLRPDRWLDDGSELHFNCALLPY